MKQDIMVIRESIGKIVSMLTHQSINVTQRGSRAFVSYHPKTGAIQSLNIPYIPDDASEEFIAAIQGFLDHEVGHVLYSDFKALKIASAAGKRVMNMANIVEDVYVERRMSEAFRGSSVNLESVRKFYLEKIARPKIAEAIAAGQTEAARGYATVAAFRAWAGQTSAADFIKEPQIAELVAPVRDKIGEELLAELGKCKNSMDCLDLARKLVAKLETPKPPPPPEPEKGMDDALDAMRKAGKLSDALDTEEEEEDKPEPEDEGTTRTEADDSGKDGAEESEALDGDVEGEAAGATDGDAGSEGTEEPTDDAGDEEEPTAESDIPDISDTSDTSDIPEGEDTDAPLGTDAAGGDEGEESSGEAGTGAEDETGEEADSPADDAESGGGEPDPLAEMFDTERDFDKDMSDCLSKDAKGELAESDYAIFSKDWDVIAPAPLSHSKSSPEKLEESLRDKIGVMQKQLERGIAAQARKAWNPAQRRGRIAPGALFKTSVGDDRVFRQRFETKAKNTAVSVVVDCSGSMNGERIELAGITSFALATVLERLKLTYEVIGFTSGASGEMMALMRDDAKAQGASIHDMGWARIEPLYMPVFKEFSGRLDTSAKSRIAHLTEHPGWLNQNIDGECIQIAAQRLKQQRAERHVMIVLSDGEPCCMYGKGLGPHLTKAVQAATKQGIEVIGIGIQTTAVKRFYPKHVVLNDLESLPTKAMAELTKILLS